MTCLWSGERKGERLARWIPMEGLGVVNTTMKSLSYEISFLTLIHMHCSIWFPDYFILLVKQNHLVLSLVSFGANSCHVHVKCINDMYLIAVFSVSMTVFSCENASRQGEGESKFLNFKGMSFMYDPCRYL